MSSGRLPGKVLAPVLGEPMIARQIERLRRASLIDELVVATSVEPGDDEVVRWAESAGVEVRRGSLTDVLDRFRAVLDDYPQAKTVIRLTADCPLADWTLVDAVIGRLHESDADWASAAWPSRTFPHGLDVEAMRPQALRDAAREATDPHDREHVTPFIYRQPERFRLAGVARAGPSLAHLRWTVDLPADLAFVRGVYAELYPRDPAFGSEAVAALAINTAEIPG